ncbi:hypothetical protein MMC28_011656 [Mycoblastus sanguinarius]|nr:hypothetical protein [Mycoblastus sanguinarius]
MPLTPEQVNTIKVTVPILQEHGNEITTRFYEEMLTEVPDLNNVFNQTNQINGQQAAALAGSLYAYAAHIDELGALSPALERISQKHASLYIKSEQYDLVGTYLLRAMKEVLGHALTQEIHDAWAVAYKQLADVMINREAQLLKEADGWTDWRDFRINHKVYESTEIISFYLAPLDKKPLPSYLPGQYISVRLSVQELDYLQARQYSLSDAPHPDHYRVSNPREHTEILIKSKAANPYLQITVKKESGLDLKHPDAKAHPGYISNTLHNEKNVGDVVQVSHPAGEFFFDTRKETSSNGPVVLVSAGVGLTPDLSIINTLIAENTKRKISWVHATRNSRVQAFKEHIKDTVSSHKNVQSHIFNKEPGEDDQEGVDYQFKGRMSLNKLDTDHDLFIHDARTEYYICGPEKFMADMESVLRGWGVDQVRIKIEVFGTGEIPKA